MGPAVHRGNVLIKPEKKSAGGEEQEEQEERHDRHFNTRVSDVHVTNGWRGGAYSRPRVGGDLPHAAGRRPLHQPLRAAAGGRDGGVRAGGEGGVLHPDADPEPPALPAEARPEPQPRESEENQVLLPADVGGAPAAGGRPSRARRHVPRTAGAHPRRRAGGLPARPRRARWTGPRRAVARRAPVGAAVRHRGLPHAPPAALALGPVPRRRLLPVGGGRRRGGSHPRRAGPLFPGALHSGPSRRLRGGRGRTAGGVARLPVRGPRARGPAGGRDARAGAADLPGR